MPEPLFTSRNVFVWDCSQHPFVEVAGFFQHGDVSICTFYGWLSQIFERVNVAGGWYLHPADTQKTRTAGSYLHPDSEEILLEGHYFILSRKGQPVSVHTIGEDYIPRISSNEDSKSTTGLAFRNRVRERDGRCCVTGDLVRQGRFHRFRATHIFPVAHLDLWTYKGLRRHIEDTASEELQGPQSINSIQNGILMRTDVHASFDAYDFAIDPDDEYRIIDFTTDGTFSGRKLFAKHYVPENRRPCPELLREHYRQCVLVNVRGTGRSNGDSFDGEELHDLSNFETWGRQSGRSWSRLELEMRDRLNGFSREQVLHSGGSSNTVSPQ